MTHAIANIQRAARAADALNRFAEITWVTTGINRLQPQDEDDAIADLICDLLHLAHLRGMDTGPLLDRARTHFAAELEEELP